MTERRHRPLSRTSAAWRHAAAFLLLCAGCGSDREAGASAAADAAPGAASTAEVDAYRSPPGFPLPFHTAVPEGFRVEEELDGPGAAVRFTAHPRDERRDSAFVYVRVMDEGTLEGRAREIVRTAAERVRIPGDRTELEPRAGHPWAVVEYPIRSQGSFGQPVQGWVALGRHDGRWFYVIAQAPGDEWARFSGRAELILANWRWAGEDGEPGPTGLEKEP